MWKIEEKDCKMQNVNWIVSKLSDKLLFQTDDLFKNNSWQNEYSTEPLCANKTVLIQNIICECTKSASPDLNEI